MTWDELADVRDPRDFHLFSVPERVADGDPWAAIDDVADDLEPLLELWREQGEVELHYPPDYPKMPGEPPRVQPSRKVAAALGRPGQPRRVEGRGASSQGPEMRTGPPGRPGGSSSTASVGRCRAMWLLVTPRDKRPPCGAARNPPDSLHPPARVRAPLSSIREIVRDGDLTTRTLEVPAQNDTHATNTHGPQLGNTARKSRQLARSGTERGPAGLRPAGPPTRGRRPRAPRHWSR